MSRAARLRCFKAIYTCFIVNFKGVGLRAAARRQAADDHFRLCILEALRDVVEILALGSCGRRAVERQRALRPRDRRRRVAPSDTLSDNGLADVAACSDDSNFLVRLIYARGEGHAHCRGAQRRRRAQEREEEVAACHFYACLACGVLRGGRKTAGSQLASVLKGH